MNRILRIWRYVFLTLPCVLITACDHYLNLDVSRKEILPGAVFDNDQSADGLVAGIYQQMANDRSTHFSAGGNASITQLSDLGADLLVYNKGDANPTAFYSVLLDPQNQAVLSLWSSMYKSVFRANDVLDGLAAPNGISDGLKIQLKGEVLFIRAFCYFYLVNCFGPVPLALTTDYRINNSLKRAPEETVYGQVVSDLNEAASLLPEGYGHALNERVRVNIAAAKALLSRVYLYRGEWAKAAEAAGEVIANTELYGLVTDLDQVFLKNSREAVWQFYVPASIGTETFEAFDAVPVSGQLTAPPYSLSPFLLAAFDADDQRKDHWVGFFTPTVGSAGYSYPYKFKKPYSTFGAAKTEYSMVLRLAEQYLIRAEARLEMGDLGGAAEDINAVRAAHAHLPGETLDSETAVRAALEKERMTEFFYEWSHRWFDLKRWGKAQQVLSSVKSHWRPEAELYPIPQKERDANPNLTQNEGY